MKKTELTMTHSQFVTLLEHLPEGIMLEIIIENGKDENGIE